MSKVLTFRVMVFKDRQNLRVTFDNRLLKPLEHHCVTSVVQSCIQHFANAIISICKNTFYDGEEKKLSSYSWTEQLSSCLATINEVYRCALNSKVTHLTTETTKTVYIQIWKLFPMICLIRSLFTPYIAEKRVGEIGTSTPVVMPILKIKSKLRQTLLLCFPCLETNGEEQGKVVSRCELVGCVTTYWGTTLLPFPWKGCDSNRITQEVLACFKSSSLCLLRNIWACFWWSTTDRKRQLGNTTQQIWNWIVNSISWGCLNYTSSNHWSNFNQTRSLSR